jgi:transposase
VCHYRGGWCLERGFHQVKDRPLGLSPLFVWRDDQILGLTHLLTVGWRLLTLIESQVRHGLAQAGATLSGLYEGQPQRVTDQPTARRLLKAFTRAQLTLTHITAGDDQLWHLTPLSPLLITILTYLGLSEMLYTDLALDSS